MSSESVRSRGESSRWTSSIETCGRPAFSRCERLSLGLAAAAIAFWGWWGVDLDSRWDREPGAEAPVIALVPSDPRQGGLERGRQLFETSGCSSCHALDGSASIGPSLRGAWGTSQPLADGTSVLFDRTYFEESVLQPEARVVRGYKPAMPSYEGILNGSDLDALAEYIRSLR